MRKIAALLLLGLGTFLIVAALVARFWAYPSVQRTPLDTDSVTMLSGEASGAVVQIGDGEPQNVVARNTTKSDEEASDGDVVVFVAGTCVAVDEDLQDGPCLDDSDDKRIVTASVEVFATDRRTGEAVDNGDYVEELPDSGVDYTQKSGLVNKWPFGVEQRDYDVWDGVLGEAVEATFDGTETIDGLETYKFSYQVQDAEVDVAADTPGTYSQEKVYWIDPATGAIMKQTQNEQRVLENGETALDLQLAYTDDTVANNVETAKDNGGMLQLVGVTGPLVAGVLGILALVGGVLLSRQPRTGTRKG